MMSIQLSTDQFLQYDTARALGIRDKTLYLSLVLPVSSTSEAGEFGYAPSSGPRSLLGDRACTHENFKGTLLYKTRPLECVLHDYGYGVILPSILIGNTWFFAASPGYSVTFEDYTRVSGSVTYIYRNTTVTVSGSNQNLVVLTTGTRESWMYGKLQATTTTYSGYRFQTDSLTDEFEQQTCVCITYRLLSSGETQLASQSVVFKQRPANDFPLDMDTIKAKVAMVGGLLLADLPTAPENFNSGVALDAVEACKVVKINTLALGRDLTSLKEVASWAKNLAKIRSMPQAARSYLGYQYGAPLTAKDVLSMVRSLSANARLRKWRGFSKARSRGTFAASSSAFPNYSWECSRTVKIVYTPVDTVGSNIVRSLYDYGMAPSMRNLWDFIPYSFVLGWAVNVNDYLSKIDAEEYLHTVNIRGVVVSDRKVLTLPGSVIDADLDGTLSYVYYHRTISSTVELENPSFSLTNPSNHLVEGGALIMARHK